ncbi:MAG: hypothetical protein HYV07_16910 [Deltaproteobacteria bacterium]|nr:hypothetical protein [Deltaproteobacteria bacterium]
MSDQTDPVVAELRLLREQQWSMHSAVIAKIGETNSRLEHLEAAVDARSGPIDGSFGGLSTAIGADRRFEVWRWGFVHACEASTARAPLGPFLLVTQGSAWDGFVPGLRPSGRTNCSAHRVISISPTCGPSQRFWIENHDPLHAASA